MKLTFTTIEDYLPIIKSMYPEIEEKELKKIIRYGWSTLYNHLAYGGDVYILNRQRSAYIGMVTNDMEKNLRNYIKCLATKFLVLYNRRKIKFDGTCYFALKEPYENLPEDTMVNFYKIKDLASICNMTSTHMYKAKIDADKLRMFVKKYPLNAVTNIELLQVREPLTLKDIFVDNNNYELL